MKAARLLINAVVAILLACFAFPAQAIDPNRMMSQYIRDRWGSARGFTGGVVTSIAQTPDGFLWIGTEKGLFRFDGLSFRVFQQAIPTTLPIGPVQALATDAHGNLWVVLQNTKILRYHEGKFDLGRDEAEAGITSVATGSDGAVLLASLAFGPLTYRADQFRVLTKNAGPATSTSAASPETNDQLSSRLAWATGVTPHRLAEPNSAVISIAPAGDGRTWLGTRDKGLFYLQDGKLSHVPDAIDEKKINCLLPIENGGLWVGTDHGLARWDGSEIIRAGVPPALAHLAILSLARDRDSNIWLGTSQGLYRYNSEGVSLADHGSAQQPLPAVNAIFEDREGNLWTGTSRGLERLRDSPFVTYSVSKGLPSESNGPVYVDSQQRTWFAPLDGGLHWLKADGQIETVSSDGLAKDVVYSLTGSASELWVGRQQGGLTRLRFNGPGFAAQTFTHSDGLIQDNVYAVYQSRGGAVWAGTLNGGVSKFQDGHFTSYTTANGLISNTISAIAETFDGTMWLATPNGLNAFTHSQWRTYAASDGLPSVQVNCLFDDSARNLWIGTAGGLAFFNAGHVQVPHQVPDSLREQIFGISEDREGWLWIATANHVLRVNSYKLLNGTLADADLREFGLEDGLNGVEGVKRQQSVFADSRGRIWFSMNRGLSVVDPARFTNSAAPALAKIESVSADGTPVDLAGPIRIPSARHRITFSYSGLSLSVPERVRYRYRLDGFDRGWSEPVASRDAVYTNLSPGSYQFRLIASNSDGVWNENGPSVSLNIVPEFYQTTWFFMLSAIFVAGLAWLAYQRHVQQVTARLDLQYKERLSERTRIARELHDTLLQSFQGLMLHFQRARNLLPGNPAQAIQRLDSALEGAEQAIVEGRNAIHDIRSSVLVNDDLAQAMTALGEELSASVATENPVALNVLVEGTARPLDSVLRDEIYRILREALRNAYAHARARNVEAEIAYGEKQLRVRIRDDGVGIDPHVLDHGARAGHWGLPGMRERAKQIGGKFDVWSELGAGTEVELTVPASVVYRSASPPAARHSSREPVRTVKEPDHEHQS